MRVEPGQRWNFVHASGKRTEYVVVKPEEEMSEETRRQTWAKWEEYAPQHLVYLLNEKTGKYAMVTYDWLHRSLKSGVSGWEAA